jgi:NifU-like protein involved in Fe-S cluster formation
MVTDTPSLGVLKASEKMRSNSRSPALVLQTTASHLMQRLTNWITVAAQSYYGCKSSTHASSIFDEISH